MSWVSFLLGVLMGSVLAVAAFVLLVLSAGRPRAPGPGRPGRTGGNEKQSVRETASAVLNADDPARRHTISQRVPR